MIDVLDIEHLLVEASQVGWQHDLIADDAGHVGAARFSCHRCPIPIKARLLSWNGRFTTALATAIPSLRHRRKAR
jgi:hypothetical protein